MTIDSRRQAACVLLAALLAMVAPAVAADEPAATALVERGELSVLFRDNSDSPRLLSGVDALFNVRQAAKFDAFDPDGKGASAGLNFEHIIGGHASPHNAFTPRQGRFDLERLPGGAGVRLTRRAEDDPWKTAATMTYTVVEPHYIDVDFRCTPTGASLFRERGYAVFFFANYMNDVADVPLHFRGIDAEGGQEKWIAADAPPGHADYNGGGTYRGREARPLAYDDDHNFKLNLWSYDYPRFTQPWYYGRAAHDMALIMMFDPRHADADEIRFSLFKFKLPRHPRPAWDWQYVIHRVEAGREYGFRARLVWKKFVSPEDCQAEYERWRAGLK
ncbi:MAG: hypothetical protein HYX69_07400 [Planctomycetia bacterium]|nr:hypothetical protein [Planctomycetia bacterium]